MSKNTDRYGIAEEPRSDSCPAEIAAQSGETGWRRPSGTVAAPAGEKGAEQENRACYQKRRVVPSPAEKGRHRAVSSNQQKPDKAA